MSKTHTRNRVIADIASPYSGQMRKQVEKAAREAYDGETQRCARVVQLCSDAGLPERAIEMIESHRTVDEVTALLQRAAVHASWDKTINNTGLAN